MVMKNVPYRFMNGVQGSVRTMKNLSVRIHGYNIWI